MPGDWSLPVNTTAYASVLADLDSRLIDAITLCSLGNPSSTPVAAKKYDEGNDKFQRWSGAAWVDLLLSLAGGGTGASTAAGARTNLGLGDMSTQSSAAVSITGGVIDGANLSADDLVDGTIAQARLGTGSAGTGTNFLADDQTYKPVGGSVIGEGKLWYTDTPPTNHLICDGSSVLRATYASLFAVIGTTWGSVDGTHFNLPDLRQRFPLGKAAAGTGNVLAGTGGSIDHTHTGPSHTHVSGTLVNSASGVLDIVGGASAASLIGLDNAAPSILGQFSGTWWNVVLGLFGGSPANPGPVGAATTTPTISGSTGSAGTGNTGTNNPPYVVVNYIIRYA